MTNLYIVKIDLIHLVIINKIDQQILVNQNKFKINQKIFLIIMKMVLKKKIFLIIIYLLIKMMIVD